MRCSEAQPGPTVDIPELLVLNRWAGNWDFSMQVKPNAALPTGGETKGTFTAQWTPDGRTLRQVWSLDLGKGGTLTGINTLTYDSDSKRYQNVSTLSSVTSEGVWDERLRTMTWTSDDPRSRTVTVSKSTFAEDGTDEWTTVTKDGTGSVIFECSGKSTRKD